MKHKKQILADGIIKYNKTVNNVSKFKFNNVETNLFCGLMQEYAEAYHTEQLKLCGVINWVTIKSNVKPNENVEECLVKYNDGQVRTALFSQEDFRFYNSINDQDISDNIQAYAELPN